MKLKFIQFKALIALVTGMTGITNCAERFSGSKLHQAAMHGNSKKIKSLLDSGADVNFLDADGRTALDVAVFNNHFLVIECLIRAKADMRIAGDAHNNNPLHLASVNGNAAVIKLLLKHAPSDLLDKPDKYGNTPLMMAMGNGNKNLVLDLLQKGANPRRYNLEGDGILHSAVMTLGSTEAVEACLEIEGAACDLNRLNSRGLSPLDRAILKNNFPIAKLYLEKGAIVNSPPNVTNSLHRAAATNFSDIHLMFSANLINSQDENGCTPLLFAVQNGQAEVVAKLLQAGADCKYINKKQESLLMAMNHQACLPTTRNIAELLLEAGANLDTATFTTACKKGNLPLLQAFTSKRKIPLIMLNWGLTLSTDTNNIECAKFLTVQRDAASILLSTEDPEMPELIPIPARLHGDFAGSASGGF